MCRSTFLPKGITMESLASRHQKLLNDCTSSLASCAELIERYSSESEKHRQLGLVKNIAREYCETEIKFKQSQSACNTCNEHFNSINVDASESVVDAYDRILNENVYEVMPYSEHPIWKSIDKAITNTQQEICAEGTNRDSSLIVSQQFRTLIDPLTKKNIETPCKSKVCGHIFEYSTIVPYIKFRQQTKRCCCPHVGCTNSNMQLKDLVSDENLTALTETLTQDID